MYWQCLDNPRLSQLMGEASVMSMFLEDGMDYRMLRAYERFHMQYEKFVPAQSYHC